MIICANSKKKTDWDKKLNKFIDGILPCSCGENLSLRSPWEIGGNKESFGVWVSCAYCESTFFCSLFRLKKEESKCLNS